MRVLSASMPFDSAMRSLEVGKLLDPIEICRESAAAPSDERVKVATGTIVDATDLASESLQISQSLVYRWQSSASPRALADRGASRRPGDRACAGVNHLEVSRKAWRPLAGAMHSRLL